MGNSFGTLFRISTWGESHGGGIGVVIDGCPPRLPISAEEIQLELDRRRPGQSEITTPRKETDAATIVSGVFEGLTLGTPIGIYVPNADQRPSAYSEMKDKFRPSHADYTYQTKFGIRNHEGGGRSSARETIGRVAAGAIAKKLLKLAGDIDIRAFITRIHDIEAPEVVQFPTLDEVEASPVRCPHPETAEAMVERIKAMRSEGDSVGGLIECRVRNLPAGLGMPVFDRLKGGKVGTATNRSGGVQGGISNGEELNFRVAFKPTATILQSQETVSKDGEETELMGRGRHDPCVVPRAVPIVEAMASLVLVDHWMRQKAQCESFEF